MKVYVFNKLRHQLAEEIQNIKDDGLYKKSVLSLLHKEQKSL